METSFVNETCPVRYNATNVCDAFILCEMCFLHSRLASILIDCLAVTSRFLFLSSSILCSIYSTHDSCGIRERKSSSLLSSRYVGFGACYSKIHIWVLEYRCVHACPSSKSLLIKMICTRSGHKFVDIILCEIIISPRRIMTRHLWNGQYSHQCRLFPRSH